MKNLWVEDYRPSSLDEYVWSSRQQREQVEAWIADGIPHLLLSGVQGSGKTSLAKLLFKAMQVPRGDIMEINASHENSVDVMRDKINNFVSTMPLGGDFKYVLLDEADRLSQPAQAILRNMMETYASSARFILTCNYPHKIIPALHSRCQGFHFDKLDRTDYTVRVGEILATEGIAFEIEVLDYYVDKTYPDLRKCINLVQQHSRTGTLELPQDAGATGSKDWLLDAVDLFKQNQFSAARKLIVEQASTEEYEEVYRFFYQNLILWGESEEAHNAAILIIAKGLRNHTICADAEINLAATLVELSQISG